MANLRKLILLVMLYGAIAELTTRDRDDDFTKIIEKISELQKHVLKLEEEIKDKIVDYQKYQMEKNDQIEKQLTNIQLQIDDVAIINSCCGCSNSTPETETPPTNTTEAQVFKPQDCYEWYDNGAVLDGEYTTYVAGDVPTRVYCDMKNGGWTVIQKRTGESVDYNRDMVDYAQGFGEIAGDHWLGLNTVHQLTTAGNWAWHFDLEDFDGETRWAEYSGFRVTAGTNFTLLFDVDSYRGTAGDDDNLGLRYNYGRKFYTRDADVQDVVGNNCAGLVFGGGGFWYAKCGGVSTTGMDYAGVNSIKWWDWKESYPLKSVTMRIRKL